mmetsp:Transcript_18149/g.30326  ORF Transcript_18149/g.30326 Transcript_18149/m.30326 type:complete len:888 (-) Transcript_18149:351-3014(-)
MAETLAALDVLISDVTSPQHIHSSEQPCSANDPPSKSLAAAQLAKSVPASPSAPVQVPAPTPARKATSPSAPSSDLSPELDQKLSMLRSVGEECVSEAELRNLVQKKPNFILYDGFEPSGRMHIAQGMFKAMNVNKCTRAGGTFIFWVADWFALMNDKMGGDLERIKTVGQYLIQVWTAAGMDMERVKFLWSSEEISNHAQRYWTQALDIARRFTVTRIKKCCQIMGRLEDTLTAAQILYPIMQCTDIFFLRADICQLGVDQRKVNMLAREYCDAAGIKLKPVILSHHMLYGLAKGQQKMSKSNLDSAIFMEDSAADVERKIRKAYCPRAEGEVEEKPEEESMHLTEDKLKNPCLDYVEHIIFCVPGATFTAGGTTYDSFVPVREAFLGGTLNEDDLKSGIISAVNMLLEPVRIHFERDAEARRILDLISGWMKEPKTQRATPLRRGIVTDLRGCSCVVFAPLPSAQPQLAVAVELLESLAATPTGSQPVLWLADWSAFCLGCLTGGKAAADDLKAINAAYSVLLGAMRALSPDLMGNVRVIKQSEVVLDNPSDYWISVINVGRAFPLSALRSAHRRLDRLPHDKDALDELLKAAMLRCEAAADAGECLAVLRDVIACCIDGEAGSGVRPADVEKLDATLSECTDKCANDKGKCLSVIRRGFEHTLDLGFNGSHVFMMLMHCADVLALAGASVRTVICCTPAQMALHEVAVNYMNSAQAVAAAGLCPPELRQVPPVSLRLKAAAGGELAGGEWDADAELLLLDGPSDVQRKLKRAFCEPGNVAFCPPLTLARRVVLPLAADRQLHVNRKSEDGGNAVFIDADEMDKAFKEGALHPGDLKPAVRDAIDAILQGVRQAVQKDSALGQAQKDLEKVIKRSAKGGGGKGKK